MKNFFEFFGFLSTACISAALIFIFIGGKKDGLKSDTREGFLTEIGADADIPAAPRAISERPARSATKGSARHDAAERPEEANVSAETRLKALYNDASFVKATAKEWKGLVSDAADEYNVKPQVLLAHVLVQAYLGDYSRNELYADAARHAGERIKPVSSALKGYRYGWTMQKLIEEYDLARYFPADAPVVTASVAKKNMDIKNVTAKGSAKTSAPQAKTNPIEEGFKSMVAKEYGFASWAGLQKLADPDTRAEAARRVKSLMMASRVR
jgi:hypothetical protein